jgi:ATP-dependent helicase/nuclease subunit A
MAATERQKEAITKHDRSIVVTAGAGTGKTFVLVQKYLHLLETRGVTVPEILALTYTEKAAAEMKERIRREISWRSGRVWEKGAADFMVAPVQTFHSFCAQILREFPVEAGLEPGFAVLDEQQMAHIHAGAYERLIHTQQEEPAHTALVRVLSCIDQYPLRGILLAMYAKRREYGRFFAALAQDEPAVLAFWQEEVHRFRDAEIRGLILDKDYSRIVRILLNLAKYYETVEDKAAQHLREIRPDLERLASFSGAESFCSSASAILTKKMGNVGSRKNWRGSDLDTFKNGRKNLIGILGQKEFLCRLTLDSSDPLVTASLGFLRDLSHVFSRYLAIVDGGKSGLGGLDFYDLILHARKLVTEEPALVATHFRPRFRYILVDEFQDTDPAQFEIVLSLVGELAPSTDSLFIVGDPKQSIYLFRDADVTRFKEAQQIIDSVCKGKIVNLDKSFRSTREVIDLANILFRALFSSVEKPWEFGYELICASEGRMDHAGSVELMLSPRGDDSASTKWNESDMVARRVHSLLHAALIDVYDENPDHTYNKRPARYGDIAILLEQRTNLSYYLSSLARYGIPYYVHGGTGFYGRQEIYDLLNILTFLESSHNDVGLFGALRSPYFGMSDAELFYLSEERGATLWEKLRKYSELADCAPAQRAVDLLSGWQKYAGRTALVVLIRKILSESGIYAVYGALPEGEQILANVEKLVAIVRVREEQDTFALADLTADLRRAMEDEEREGEAPLDALAENAVNIMTVHAAKGLEFPIVIVPDMGVPFRERFDQIMIGDDPRLVGVRVPNPDDSYALADTPVLTMLRELQRQKERAERKRLLYVALTRARDHLFMSGTCPEDFAVSPHFARTRIEWVCSSLGITREAVEAGRISLGPGDGTGPVNLTILSKPEAIPAELAEAKRELITVPEECAGKCGSRVVPELPAEKGREFWTVSEVEELLKSKPDRKTRSRVEVEGEMVGGVTLSPTDRGTIIHEVLRGRDPVVVCVEFGIRDEHFIQKCRDICARFRESQLMQGVKREFCELPFSAKVYGVPFRGSIDRLCELENRMWAVIDYKSEPVSPAEYALKAEEYEIQMVVYLEAAKLIVKKPVSGYLYFTETGEFHRMKEPDERVRQRIQNIVKIMLE